MALPQLTDEQRKQALEKAAAARHARAELREQIKKGEKSLESVLNSDDPIASRMKVSTLIESLPGYGKAKAAKIMEELGISATRRVQGLGVRQREQLLEQLTKSVSAQDSKLFVISGPSGAGKGTLVTRVRERRSNLGLTVSATTRAPRKGEVDGVNYFFLTREEFDRRVANGEFVEWAEVHGNCYGTLVSEVTSKLASGSSLILEIDVQGALQVKERFPEAVLIFIKPPSLEVLRERLVGRGTETPETIELRMANAADELALADRYDDVVVNDDLDRATDELVRVLDMHERI